MATGWNIKVPHHHGVGNAGHYAICDVCGRKFRAKNLVLVNDKLNTQNGLLVCKADKDKTNQQMLLEPIKIRHIPNPAKVRVEQPAIYSFIDTIEEVEHGSTTYPSGNAPGAPTQLIAEPNSDGDVMLAWTITLGVGSSPIKGYKIERESPVGGGFSTIVANSSTVATYYLDTTTSSSTQYNYRISAINDHGTSTVSNSASTTTL
jgi:hypothetical protein